MRPPSYLTRIPDCEQFLRLHFVTPEEENMRIQVTDRHLVEAEESKAISILAMPMMLANLFLINVLNYWEAFAPGTRSG